jgi:hypothetical protein
VAEDEARYPLTIILGIFFAAVLGSVVTLDERGTMAVLLFSTRDSNLAPALRTKFLRFLHGLAPGKRIFGIRSFVSAKLRSRAVTGTDGDSVKACLRSGRA